jgi:hypothetical protein
MKFSRTLLAVAVAVLGAFALAGTAAAAPAPAPQPQTINLAGRDDVGKDGYCRFPVTIVYTSKQLGRPNPNANSPVVPGKNGITTGNATATVTNVDTGKTLTYNVSGPGVFTQNPDGSFSAVAGGPNLLWTTFANSYPGVPQLAYSTGRVQFAVDASGQTTSYSLSGNRTDVCAALA